MKKLPIGIQTFSQIIEENYLYIDKTKIAFDLIENSKYVFLSRPRRFGKSLFVDTLKNIFQANKTLFEGLLIYDKYDWNKSYPVINISFASGTVHSREALDRKIISILEYNQRDLGVECKDLNSPDICFEDLIIKSYEKYNKRVVILIDEYDKPLLDNISDSKIAYEMRDGLRNFYSVIKGSDEYIEFAFLTGVSKFSKVSIFSGLNNIDDISLDRRYGNICGYTQNDIESTFLPYLQGVDLAKLKLWYNGYNFLGDKVYNPFDILLFFSKGKLYKNYWFETGTPNFLIELLKQKNYFIPQLENLKTDESLINSFDIENIRLETILFQAGYLTIESVKEKRTGRWEYTLTPPNQEVRNALNDTIIEFLTEHRMERLHFQDMLYDTLFDNDLEKFKEALVSLFASIPYNNYVKNTILNFEGYYASVIYAYLASLGFDLTAEDVTNRGRIDLTIKTEKYIYILEFKVGDENALEQIKSREYQQKYLSESRDIFLVGINFDEVKRNIMQFEWEKIYEEVI